MAWLARKGYRVTGIELSEVAARDFFQENDLDCTATRIGGAPAYFGGGITIICADFFAADFSELAPADAVYDRASLVTLPPEMRPAYAARLTGLIAPATRILLVTLDYRYRWYVVTDRSLRIREGLWRIQERTMTHATTHAILKSPLVSLSVVLACIGTPALAASKRPA